MKKKLLQKKIEKNKTKVGKKTKFVSIRHQLTKSISAGIILISLVAIVVIGQRISKVTNALMTDHIINTSDNAAKNAVTSLTDCVSAVGALGGAISGWQVIDDSERRRIVTEIVRKNLQHNSSVVSVWAQWLPETFDSFDQDFINSPYSDSSGRFIVCLSRNGTTIKEDHLPAQKPDWIRYVMDNPRPHFLEPHVSMVNGVQDYIVSAVAPIYNSKSDIVGMVGYDLSLKQINTQLASLRIYDTGYGIFTSSNGFILGHKDPSFQGQRLEYFGSSEKESLFENARIRKTPIAFRELNKNPTINVIVPVYVDSSGMPWFFVTITPLAEVVKTIVSLVLFVIVALIVLLIVSISITVLATGRITKPLKQIAAALKNISEGDGDLTVRLTSSEKNEVGLLADSFNMTMEKIANSISLIKSESVVMKRIGTDLSENMVKTSDAVGTITKNIHNVKYQMQEHSAGVVESIAAVNQILKNIDDLNKNVEEQAVSVTQSANAVKNITENIRSVDSILKSNEMEMSNLKKASDKGLSMINENVSILKTVTDQSIMLSEASKLIKKIAAQTNILSMNASIEAAHAGQAGIGFAVVAHEIRGLAEQSRKEGDKIEHMLKSMEQALKSATVSAFSVQSEFNTIFNLIMNVGDKEDSIISVMKSQNESGYEILQAVNNIQKSTEKVKLGSEEMFCGSKEVGIEMSKLSEMTEDVKNSITEITEKTQSIIETVGTVSEMSDKNLSSIGSVLTDIGRFKVEEELLEA